MKSALSILLIISSVLSQSLNADALLKNTFYSAQSSMRGHAHSTYDGSPLNAYFNPAGLATISTQKMQLDLSTYMNTKEFPNSETVYPISINSLIFAAPFSSNKKSFIFSLSLRAPLLNSYEYTFSNGIADSEYSESYQIYQLGFSVAQKLSKEVRVGFTYASMIGSIKFQEKIYDGFSKKRKDELKIIESPKQLIFGIQYAPYNELQFGMTFQTSSKARLRDTRINDKNGHVEKSYPVVKLGAKFDISEMTDLYIDYHRVNRGDNNDLNSVNAGFDLDIFEDLGFGLGMITFAPFSLDEVAYTTGISYKGENYILYISLDYANGNRRAFYFNHTESSKYLLQSSIEYTF